MEARQLGRFSKSIHDAARRGNVNAGDVRSGRQEPVADHPSTFIRPLEADRPALPHICADK